VGVEVEDGEYEAGRPACVPAQYGEHSCLRPCAVIQFDSRLHLRCGTPARRMLRYKKNGLTRISTRVDYSVAQSTCEDGTNFCVQHRKFMTSNRTRMILPEECAVYRFGVGHAARVWTNVFLA
jgi:hypothetical protein